MTILREQAENVLYQALNATVGIQVLITDDSRTPVIAPSLRAKQTLYRFRNEIGDIELKRLQIRLCPSDPDNRLWIIKANEIEEKEDLQ